MDLITHYHPWNPLPQSVKYSRILVVDNFKFAFKKHLFFSAYCRCWFFIVYYTATGWARFLLCTCFILFFLVLLVTHTKPPLGQIIIGSLNHATCQPKANNTLMYVSLLCINVFSFGFIDAWDSKQTLNTLLKRYCISHGMCWHGSFHFCH